MKGWFRKIALFLLMVPGMFLLTAVAGGFGGLQPVMAASSTSEEKAIDLAKDVCRKKGWPWKKEIIVMDGGDFWIVKTNAGSPRDNAQIGIEKETGKILDSSFNS
ncbi:MAG TPA: hypothetical protein PLL75_05915 [Candidatus Omnitrophota bacterium]|nr:hypothetical protein [Candidatus Omnitrophota bacterium]HPS37244.1 hypothetical protein [Candidatus Omnitrophota bacterium]